MRTVTKTTWIHMECGGTINIKSRLCTKCGKTWSFWDFFMDPVEIRPLKTTEEVPETSYAKWADRVPYVSYFAGRLPNWPRWARILSTLLIYGILVFGLIIVFFQGVCR